MTAAALRNVLGMTVAGLVLIAVLIPDDTARVGLMMRDGADRAAQELNEALLAAEPDDPVLLHRAFLLRGAAGDIAGTTEAAERLFAATGGRIDARRLLAAHYFRIGAMEKRADIMLEADPALLTAPERDRLLGELRYAGRYADERAQLERMAATGLLDPAQEGRLGMLLAVAGNRDAAIAHLLAHDDRSETVDAETLPTRLTLLHLLIARDRLEEARSRAQQWQEVLQGPEAKAAIAEAVELDAYGADAE